MSRSESLWLLIDGYNVIAPTAPPRYPTPDWLRRERKSLLDRLAEHLDEETCRRCCVVFDAADPPPGRESRIIHHGIDVRFAVDFPEADDLVEAIIAAHSAPKTLTVISGDRRLQEAARRRNCNHEESQTWFDDVLDGKIRLSPHLKRGRTSVNGGQGRAPSKPEAGLPNDEVQDWLDEFGI
ncbi:MAG: NYN domain-containing protein [Planctomycetota bacterium]